MAPLSSYCLIPSVPRTKAKNMNNEGSINDVIQMAKKEIKSEFGGNVNVEIIDRTDSQITVCVKGKGMFTFTFYFENFTDDSNSFLMEVYNCHSHGIKQFQVSLEENQERKSPNGELSFYERYVDKYLEQEK